MNPSTARTKGRNAELATRDYLRSRGIPAVSVHDGGTVDEGDLYLPAAGGVCVQVKAYRDGQRAIREGLAVLPGQVERSGAALGVVVQRPHGQPDPAGFRVVLTLDTFAGLLAALGRGGWPDRTDP